MNKSMVFLVVLSIVALSIFFWPRKSLEISRQNEISGSEADKAVSAAKNICEVGKLKNDVELKALMIPMDGMGFNECRKIMEDLKSPEFAKAKVSSPSFNADIYYVFVPENKKDTCQFTMRKKYGKLLLEGACLKTW
jgi:hypothetical protein